MADVFISYKRDERDAIEQVASRLRALGLTVWFDASLSAGETFNAEIDREARAAKAILVCWSPAARQSEWVNAEAMIGFEQKTLAACYVAGPDNFSAPTPFNATHAEDLRAWLAAPSETHAGWKSVLRRIGKLCGREDIEGYGALDVQAPASVLRAWLAQHEASPLFMAVDELLRARDFEEAERARLEQEARERRAREEAERRAREEAERQAREEQERRQREERARLEREAQAARKTEAARTAKRTPWELLIISGVVVAVVIWISLNAGREQGPTPQQTEVQEPQTQEAAQPPAQTRVEELVRTPPLSAEALPEMVRIPGRNFEVGRYEVTFAQWDACVTAGGCNVYTPYDPGWGRGNRPVINVSWNDAQAYVQWLSQNTGQRYRLLTEAEWEYAARAGTTTNFWWGDQDPVCDRGARSGAQSYSCTPNRTLPVGSFQPNGFGLYDVHGNVSEWVEDAEGSSRFLRGGSWSNLPQNLRSAYRLRGYPTGRNDNHGFRVARTV
jgi:formylglycine-generating enzyme required for sulfatase activity